MTAISTHDLRSSRIHADWRQHEPQTDSVLFDKSPFKAANYGRNIKQCLHVDDANTSARTEQCTMHTPLLRGKVTNKYRDYKVKIQKKKKKC